MKREIKFRGKSKIYGCWRFGDLYRTNLEGGVAIQFYDEVDGWMTEDVNPKTIGQFTGVLDGRNQEIYENDIVATYFDGHCTYQGEVRFEAGRFIVSTNNGLLTNIGGKSWLIIGNIHDNPELMKGGEKCQ